MQVAGEVTLVKKKKKKKKKGKKKNIPTIIFNPW